MEIIRYCAAGQKRLSVMQQRVLTSLIIHDSLIQNKLSVTQQRASYTLSGLV